MRSPEWERTKAEVRAKVQDLDAQKQVYVGVLRAIENEEAKAKDATST